MLLVLPAALSVKAVAFAGLNLPGAPLAPTKATLPERACKTIAMMIMAIILASITIMDVIVRGVICYVLSL
jgi:hypothetical protein